MVRPRSFDREAVLSSAMHVFRRLGFAGASIKDLEAATGLTSGSLYNAFDSKEGLFRIALEHYVDAVVRARLVEHAGSRATLEDLEQLLLSIWEMPFADGFGCLVANSAIEFGAGPSIGREGVDLGIDLVEKHIAALLERELDAGHARSEAPRLVLIYKGILVLTRAGRLDPTYADAVRADFARLRALRQDIRSNKES